MAAVPGHDEEPSTVHGAGAVAAATPKSGPGAGVLDHGRPVLVREVQLGADDAGRGVVERPDAEPSGAPPRVEGVQLAVTERVDEAVGHRRDRLGVDVVDLDRPPLRPVVASRA